MFALNRVVAVLIPVMSEFVILSCHVAQTLRLEATSPHSAQPHVEEDQEYGSEEEKPYTPADAGPFGHAEHTVHVPSDAETGIFERVI